MRLPRRRSLRQAISSQGQGGENALFTYPQIPPLFLVAV